MGNRLTPFVADQWYHCFNRGVDKRRTFMDVRDYERFLMLMYACNNAQAVHVSNFEQGIRSKRLSELLKKPREQQLVYFGAYSLMPNHYHMMLREKMDGGISSFMRKLGTAYTMYFNIRHERTGILFQGVFKSKHIDDDQYLSRVLSYIHANHAELHEPKWKSGVIRNRIALEKFLLEYRYSSLNDYTNIRAESTILDMQPVLEVAEVRPTLSELLKQARIYARETEE